MATLLNTSLNDTKIGATRTPTLPPRSMSTASRINDTRRGPRLTISIPVTIRGTDLSGNAFEEVTRTTVVNKHGGRLLTRQRLHSTARISIENPAVGRKSDALVTWFGEKAPQSDGIEIGVSLLEPIDLWGVRFPGDSSEPAAVGKDAPAAERCASIPVAQLQATLPSKTIPPVPNVATEAPVPREDKPVASVKPVPTPAVADADLPRASSKPNTNPEELEARLQAVLAEGEKRVKDMAELQTKLLITHLGRMATERRDSLRAEMEQFLTELCRSYLQKVHQQAQNDLKVLRQRMAKERKQAVEGIIQDLQARLAFALHHLDQKEPTEAA